MASRGRNQRGHETNEIVVHVSGVSEGSGGGSHDVGHQGVGLGISEVGALKSIVGDSIKGSVIEDDDTVSVKGKALEGEEGVVGLDDGIRDFDQIGENGVGLNELFGESVVDSFEEIRAETGAGTTSDGVAEDKTIKTVRAVSLTIDHIHDLFLDGFTNTVAYTPIVTGSSSFFAEENVFGVVELAVGRFT
jgi:hypothetical protein